MVLALAAFAAAVAIQVARDRTYSREQAQNRALLYVRSPEAIRRQLSDAIRARLSAGFDVRPMVDVTVLDGG